MFIDEEIEKSIVSALDMSLTTEHNTIYLPVKIRTKKAKKREGKRLSTFEPEPIPSTGTCPGGKYYYIDNKKNLIELLQRWIDNKAWCAIDLETGVAWREKPDLESDDTIRYYAEVIDPYTCPIFLVSMSVEPGVAVVFDIRPFKDDPEFLIAWKTFLQTCRLIAHNALFEQSFLCSQFGVVCNIVYDTMLVHQLMTAGNDTLGSGLAELMDRYCGIKMDKQWQKFFLTIDYRSAIPAEAIAYSAGDVCQLLTLARKLEEELKATTLYPVWTTYEQPFMKWLALAKVHGIATDKEFFDNINKELATEIEKLLLQFNTLCPGVLISSPAQLKVWFAKQGVNLRSTDVTALGRLVDVPTIGGVAKVILDYRKLAKMKNTYIEPLLRELPCPITGRVHPNWGQLFTTTGRMNCNDPNMQNMPSKDEWVKIRKGFIAQPGHTLAYCDYSQFEVRAMADMSGEDRMIDVFKKAEQIAQELSEYYRDNNLPENLLELAKEDEVAKATAAKHPKLTQLTEDLANCDFHRLTASMLFGTPVAQVTKEERSKAKAVTFGKPYGAGPKTIARSAGISVEEATVIFKDYDVKFPKLATFFEECREKGKKGFTETPAGRKRFYQMPDFASLMYKVKMVAKAGGKDWEDMIETWGTSETFEITNKLHQAKVSSIEREAMNHPIQGLNADATKLATILAAPRLQKLHKECIIIAWIHDEIILTAPDAVVKEAATILRGSMIEAAQGLLKQTPVDVSISISKTWGK